MRSCIIRKTVDFTDPLKRFQCPTEVLKSLFKEIYSYKYKMKKPDHCIYEKLLEDYQLNASECVFIDDRQENIDAAKEVGFAGILFENYEQAKAELDALLAR